MTETASGKIQETQIGRYRSTVGIDYGSVPWRLWERAKELFWDPKDLDFSKDAVDWAEITDQQRGLVLVFATAFMQGEEVVTLDILPLLRVISDESRLEETVYLSSFAMEEAKHVDFFRRWFDAVGADPATVARPYGTTQNGETDAQTAARPGGATGSGLLTKVMRRLDHDQSPEAILDASLVYNQLVEGVSAIAGYRGFDRIFQAMPDRLPGLREGLSLVQRDERRHIAYGTYLCRRLIAEHPHLWEFAQRRWDELTGGIAQDGGYGGGPLDPQLRGRLAARRLEAIGVARSQAPGELRNTAIEELEPDEGR